MKCPVCGFTGFFEDEIHWTKRELAVSNKMMMLDEAVKKALEKITHID
jgi:predicted nucleic-acid-binding Zn-ribbon protein